MLVKSEPRVKSERQDKEGERGTEGGVRSIPPAAAAAAAAAGWQKTAIMLNVMCPSSSGAKTGWRVMAWVISGN